MKIQNILIVSIIIVTLFSISLVSASLEPFAWEMYGKDFTPNYNSQFFDGKGKFQTGIVNQSMTQGMTITNGQAIVSKLNSSEEKMFLIIPNGNFLQVYNSNFDLVSEAFTIQPPQQLVVLDFDNDGNNNDIASAYKINDSLFAIRVYKFGVVGEDLTKIFEKNFTTQISPIITGLKKSGERLYFLYNYKLFNSSFFANLTILNSTDETQIEFPTSPTAYTEPLHWIDMDFDGTDDFMTFSTKKVAIVDENGVLKFELNFSATSVIQNVKILSGECDLTFLQFLLGLPCNVDWRVVTLFRDFGLGIDSLVVRVHKLDGSLLWDDIVSGLTELTSGDSKFGTLAIGDQFGDDSRDVLYLVMSSTGVNFRHKFRVYQGKDGTLLESRDLGGFAGTDNFLTLADMNENGVFDFILVSDSRIFVYDPVIDSFLLNEVDVSIGNNYCVPADVNNDGFIEIICSKSGNTKMYLSDFSNQNAFVTSVTLDPSNIVAINQTLFLFIGATDPEGQQIFFKHRCEAGLNFTNVTSSSDGICVFDSIGIKTLTVAVKDPFFTTFNTFDVIITVTESGVSVCGDLICEGAETNFNCAIDCPLGNVSQAGLSGSIPLPTELVELDNTNKGLLPEIYFGTIGFMSSVLSPTIVLVFLFFLVMIMVTVAIIIKKIAQRIGSVGG